MLKRLIFIWEKGTFFFAQLCPVVARTLLESRNESFDLGPKIQILAQKFGFWPKNPFFWYRTLDFDDGPFVALGKTVHLQPLDRFFDFSFPRNRRTRQKIFPHPTVGAPSASNSPSARAGQFHAYFRRKMLPESRHISRRQKMSLWIRGKQSGYLARWWICVFASQGAYKSTRLQTLSVKSPPHTHTPSLSASFGKLFEKQSYQYVLAMLIPGKTLREFPKFLE